MSADPERSNARLARDQRGARIGSDLAPRVAAGLVMGLAALVVAWFGGIVFVAFWWIASIVVLWEWQRIVARERLFFRVAAGALPLALAGLLALHNLSIWAVVALAAAVAAVGFATNPGTRVWAGAGALYAGSLVVGLALLRATPTYGLAAVLWLFAIVWGADVAAYFAGRAIGGPRLWPSVSPGKTWSGAVA